MAQQMPTLKYFPLMGLGESIRLVLAAADQDWKEEAPDFGQMKAKAGTAESPFGQAPLYSDENVQNAIQSGAIVRYLARKHGMYGSTPEEMLQVDTLLDADKDFVMKYVPLIYKDECSDAAMKAFVETHLLPGDAEHARGGPHMMHLEKWLSRNNGGSGWMVGDKLTVADTQIYWLVYKFHGREAFQKVFDFKKHYPLLTAHYERVKSIPGIAKYLASPKRFTQLNGNVHG